jgi:hypothetical protein
LGIGVDPDQVVRNQGIIGEPIDILFRLTKHIVEASPLLNGDAR